MSNNIKVLLVGPGYMGREYYKVLKKMSIKPIVVGREEESAEQFRKETGCDVMLGGMAQAAGQIDEMPDNAIVSVSVDQLANTAIELLEAGVKSILLEKPGGINREEIQRVCDVAEKKSASVYVAYNRRFYSSTDKALQIIKEDGGVKSFCFEFTEWGHVVRGKALGFPEDVRETWFLLNSTHVVDLAFFLGGFPAKINTYVSGDLDWHKKGCIYAGAGVSVNGALFSYQANWAAPGRWAVEILTNKHRLYFKPMEELAIQELGSVKVNKLDIDDRIDKEFKPGLYRQVESFLRKTDDGKKITIEEQLKHMDVYEMIEGN